MKKIEWLRPNKMKFESEHKTFNSYIEAILFGEVTNRGQWSRRVRAYNHNKGKLRDFDLNDPILRTFPSVVKNWIKIYTNNHPSEDVIVYKWFHVIQDRHVTMGYAITTGTQDSLGKIRLLKAFEIGGSKKRSALHECIKYVSDVE